MDVAAPASGAAASTPPRRTPVPVACGCAAWIGEGRLAIPPVALGTVPSDAVDAGSVATRTVTLGATAFDRVGASDA